MFLLSNENMFILDGDVPRSLSYDLYVSQIIRFGGG